MKCKAKALRNSIEGVSHFNSVANCVGTFMGVSGLESARSDVQRESPGAIKLKISLAVGTHSSYFGFLVFRLGLTSESSGGLKYLFRVGGSEPACFSFNSYYCKTESLLDVQGKAQAL